MDFQLVLLFSIFGFCTSGYSDRQFHYIKLKMTWSDAQRYCREKYTDLATIENEADISKFHSEGISVVWIGLHDDPMSWNNTLGKDTNSWRWSHTGETGENGYHNRKRGQPDNAWSKEHCVEAVEDGLWGDCDCRRKIRAACYSAPSPEHKKKYFISKTTMTWKEAQTYCRSNYKDLAVIENAEENQELSTLKGSTNVWIGLYRHPWRWSDNRDSSYRRWTPGQPNNYYVQYCTGITVQHYWEDYICTSQMPFWCQEVPQQTTTILRMKIHTSADLSDPTVNTQLLQQIGDRISKQTGQADVNLKWTIRPTKEEEKPKAKGQCPAKVNTVV